MPVNTIVQAPDKVEGPIDRLGWFLIEEGGDVILHCSNMTDLSTWRSYPVLAITKNGTLRLKELGGRFPGGLSIESVPAKSPAVLACQHFIKVEREECPL